MLNIVIVGAGGCAREVYEMAKETFSSEEYLIKGFLSDDLKILDGYVTNLPIIDSIEDYKVKEDDRFLLAIGDVEGRKTVLNNLKKRGAKFLSLIHPTAQIVGTAHLGEGIIVYRAAGVSDHANIGDYCMINAMAMVGHDAIIGANTVLCPYAAILGNAQIGSSCLIGTHATVNVKISVGSNSRVGANSFVHKSIPDESLAIGVPAKIY